MKNHLIPGSSVDFFELLCLRVDEETCQLLELFYNKKGSLERVSFPLCFSTFLFVFFCEILDDLKPEQK